MTLAARVGSLTAGLLLMGCDLLSPQRADPLTVVWSAGERAAVTSIPVLLSPSAIVATYMDRRVRAHELGNGRLRWTSPDLGGDLYNVLPIVDREATVLVVRGLELIALKGQDGSVAWRRYMPIDSSALPYGPGALERRSLDLGPGRDKGVVPAWGSTISVVSTRDGSTVWSWSRGGPHTRRHGANGALWCGDLIYGSLWSAVDENITQSRHTIVALNASSGAEVWRVELPFTARGVAANGSMSCNQQNVFATTLGGPLWALDRFTGAIRWRVDRPSGAGNMVGPVIINGVVVADDGASRGLIGIDASTGAVLWRRPLGVMPSHRITWSGGVVWIMDGGRMRVLDAATGEVFHSTEFDTMLSMSSPLVLTANEAVAATQNGLVRLRLRR